jgi:hypothetical protein
MTYQIPQHDDPSRYQAQRHIHQLRARTDRFVDEMNKLPKPVRESPPIVGLTALPFCLDAIMHGVGQRSDSDAFRDARDLVDYIGQWLLTALRIADRIIEDHFDKQPGGS